MSHALNIDHAKQTVRIYDTTNGWLTLAVMSPSAAAEGWWKVYDFTDDLFSINDPGEAVKETLVEGWGTAIDYMFDLYEDLIAGRRAVHALAVKVMECPFHIPRFIMHDGINLPFVHPGTTVPAIRGSLIID